MKYGSVCSGIEAATVAWEPLGWTPAWFSEIEKFPAAVLQHHYPEVPNHGDFTRIRDIDHPADRDIDLLVGGTPCFPSGTTIATRDGFKSIEDVVVGDNVLTHEGRFRPVLRVGSKEASTVVVRGQGHCGLVTTREHPFLARRKSSRTTRVGGKAVATRSVGASAWVEAKDLAGCHWACVSSWPGMDAPVIEPVGRESRGFALDENLFTLAGAYLGDGWVRINQRRGYVLFGLNRKKLDALRPMFDAVGAYSVAEMRTSLRVAVSSRALVRWLVEHFGRGAANKRIPMWALGLPEALRRALLHGYEVTDGCRSADGTLKMTTVSRQLALTTRMLANSLGFASSVFACRRPPTCMIEGRVVAQRDTYTVTASASARTSFEADGYRWQCVRGVVDTGRVERVYNLEVEEDNSYVVDGIAVHNCQDFSVAGLRAGLDGARGQLTLEFCRLVGALRPRWVVWENVPGVLSANGGRAFGSFLGALAELGYGFSWRVLDAQFFGLAQRRKRVFVVAHSSGDWRRAAAVLFEPEGVYGDPPTRSGSGQDSAGDAGSCAEDRRGAVAFSSKDYGADAGPLSPTLRSAGHDGSHANAGAPPAVAFNWMSGGDVRLQPTEEKANSLQRSQTQAVCVTGAVTHALRAEGADGSEDGTGRGTPIVTNTETVVRRLTPVECERLQGFPDNFTRIPWGRKSADDCPDGPRYKVLGNSMAVPVMHWIGRRVDAVDRIR